MNLSFSAIISSPGLFEESGNTLERRRLHFVTHGPFCFLFNRYGRIDDRHCIAQPATKTLDLTDDLDIFVPVHTSGDGPHDFAFVKDVDVFVDNYGEFQVRHFDKCLHASLVRFVLELFLDGYVANATAATRSREMDCFYTRHIFLDDVVSAAFFGNAAEIPVVHMPGPEVFDNAAAPVGDCGDLYYGYVHFRLCVTENFAKWVLWFTHARKDFSFNDDLSIRRHHKFITPGCRRCQA